MFYIFIINAIVMIALVLLECIAGLDRPPVHPPLEPLRSLCGSPVGKRVGTDLPSRHALKAVVTYCRRRAERALDVASLQEISSLRRFCPNTRETVSLQLEPNRERILRTWVAALQAPDLPFDAHQILNMVSEFVRQDVGLRELAGRSKSALQLVIKAKVNVDLLVLWTVERPRCRLRCSAAGRRNI